MRIIQVINTNTVITEKNGKYLILMGRNIGYRKKPGQEIDESLIEKVFEESNENIKNIFNKNE